MSKRKKGFEYPGISVCYFCHDGKGNFLMQKRGENSRDEHGRWDTGGGALEFGEKIEDCLRKEIKEEFCADIIAFEFLGYRDVHRTHEGKPTHWISLSFKVLVDPSQVKNGEPHKFDEIRWFKKDSIPNNLHSQLPQFFDKFDDKLFN